MAVAVTVTVGVAVIVENTDLVVGADSYDDRDTDVHHAGAALAGIAAVVAVADVAAVDMIRSADVAVRFLLMMRG